MSERERIPPRPGGSTSAERPARALRGDAPLHRADLDRVIRRAAELQHGEGGSDAALSEDEILRIGREVGLEPAHLRRALGELRSERLLPALPAESGLSVRVLGTARVQATRVVPGTVEEVSAKLHAWLRDSESLVSVRERVGASMWEPSVSIGAWIQRSLGMGGRRFDLSTIKSVEVAVTPVEEGLVQVTLTADLSNRRNEDGWGWVGGLGVGGLVVSGVSAATMDPTLLLAAGIVGAGVGLGALSGVFAGRVALSSTRERVAAALEGVIDRAE